MKHYILLFLLFLSPMFLRAGVLSLDDGGVIEAEIVKITAKEFTYKNIEGKLLTLPLKRLVSYEAAKAQTTTVYNDSPEEFANYTAKADLKLPFSVTDRIPEKSDPNAIITVNVKRQPNPETKAVPPKVRTPIAVLYFWVEREDPKTPGQTTRSAYLLSAPSGSSWNSRCAIEKSEREKILRSNRRSVTDFVERKGKLARSISDVELKMNIGSKLKNAKILAYRFELWGTDPETPLDLKSWKGVGVNPETNWWYNAR